MEESRDQVGMLCDQLSRFQDLHDIIRDAGAGGELDKLLATLSGKDEPNEDQVLAWLQAIDDACARKGLAGITSREHAFRPPFPPVSDSWAWVCPRGRCNRVVLPEETQTPPVCAVDGGAPMKPFTLLPS